MSGDQVVTQLRAVDLFAGMTDKDLKALAERGSVVEHPAGHVIAEQDHTGVGLHVFLSGTADVEVGGQPSGSLNTGDSFGEISLIDGEPRSATVRVGSAGATTFSLTSWQFTPFLQEHPEVQFVMLKVLCARLRHAEAQLPHG